MKYSGKGESRIMPHGFRETLQFYLIDCKTAFGKIIDIFIILLNLFICAILVHSKTVCRKKQNQTTCGYLQHHRFNSDFPHSFHAHHAAIRHHPQYRLY